MTQKERFASMSSAHWFDNGEYSEQLHKIVEKVIREMEAY